MTDQQHTDQDFHQALGANPRAVPEPADPDHYARWLSARNLESRIESVMQSVLPPPGMQQQLLDLANSQGQPRVVPAENHAANATLFWQRLLPTAAILMLALGLGWYFQLDKTLELQNDLFGHLYAEEPYYPQNRHYDLADVNTHLEGTMGAHIKVNEDTRALDVTFLKDCKVAKQTGTHLVMQGNHGLVNIIVLPTEVVDTETTISDEHFSGFLTPASGRTLVVIGNKQETIAEYRNLLNSSIEWEY